MKFLAVLALVAAAAPFLRAAGQVRPHRVPTCVSSWALV
jgi:hypothetical protein